MARFGKLPVKVPNGVTVEIDSDRVKVTGPKGTLERELPRGVTVTKNEDSTLTVGTKDSSQQFLSLQGTARSHIVNMITGVTEGWSKNLELVGAGYRAEIRGNQIVLSIGYSHPVTVTAPAGINFKLEKSIITVEGADKDVVGQVAADIRVVRPPEPYKGKGIKYVDEVIRRKAGKQAAKAAA